MSSIHDYEEDPRLHDENDPEYREEIFRSFQAVGWGPEQIADADDREKYREWLKTAPPVDES